jgi:protein kinase C substrate 80K-H
LIDGKGADNGSQSIVASHYKNDAPFACITKPDIVIDFDKVNDDYCDCPDGSDEPGTAACAYLEVERLTSNKSPPALPGFYCANKGHKAGYLPFSRVGDGVCDYSICCDGSEEWEKTGVKCENKCKEIGKKWRKQEADRVAALNAGIKKRKVLLVEAVSLRKEVEDRINTITVEIEATQIRVQNLEKELKDVERAEKAKVVKGAGKSRWSVLTSLAKDRISELRDHLVYVRGQRDFNQARVRELEAILKTFKEEYNPNFNDEGVKRAVRAWEDYSAKELTDPENDDSAYETDLEEILKSDEDTGRIKWEEWEKEAPETDVEACK